MSEQSNSLLSILYSRLLFNDVFSLLPGVTEERVESLTHAEQGRLLTWASQLAFGEAKDKTIAYNIATRIAAVTAHIPFVVAAKSVLSRIGNFPGRDLLRKYHPDDNGSIDITPLFLSAESLSREIQNTPTDVQLPLTDFQCDLLESVLDSQTVSISAPTSAGKTYAFSIAIGRQFIEKPNSIVVYVVPTRALVHEVMHRIVTTLRGIEGPRVPVHSIPGTKSEDSGPAVFVLTQERLLALLFADDPLESLDLLIIDEAQVIRDGARGVLLHSAIDTALGRFPEVKLLFASPLAGNPEYLVTLFDRTRASRQWIEQLSPVSQNLILVSAVPRKPTQAEFALLLNTDRCNLGQRKLEFSLRASTAEIRANFAVAITRQGETTLIYANGPAETEKVCERLIQTQSECQDLEPEIHDLVAFIEEHIHPQYSLGNYLRYRVAFHYGHMPPSIRSRIEELAKAGLLRYVCCTSTLLQGVNLPAKHVIILDPTRGTGQPMTRGDFLNLAGRAGRLTREFQGNVWCILPEKWANASYEGQPLDTISSSYEEVLRDGGKLVSKVLRNEAKGDEIELGTAAAGKMFNDFVLTDRPIEDSQYASIANVYELKRTTAQLRELNVTLPADIFAKNMTVLPQRLQSLYDYLTEQNPIDSFVPAMPTMTGAYERLKSVFRLIEEQLRDVHNRSYEYHAWLAHQWMWGKSLREIISLHVRRQKESGTFSDVDHTIRDVLKAIEDDLQFRYAKYLRAYIDVLTQVLLDRHHVQAVEEIPPIHLFLEHGTWSQAALKLLSFGVSRTTALLLVEKLHISDGEPIDKILLKVRNADYAQLGIPALSVSEIRMMLDS